jgi:hypothetical protein
MPAARVQMGVGSRGVSLRTIARELRGMDDAKVTGIFKKALEGAARPYPMRVRLAVLAIPVTGEKHTGLRARIALCATETSWTTGREAGVSVWMDTRRMLPDYRTLPLYMDAATGPRRGYTRWRHPVYGRWLAGQPNQPAHPYFYRATGPLGAAAGEALRASLEDIKSQLNG